MNKGWIALIVLLCVLLIGLIVFFAATPIGRTMWNNWFYVVQKADDATLYATRKKVEDTCRAMMASYVADELTYKQYKDSASEEQRGWAAQAKMRANKTAASYNEYILKNSFVWEGNVPDDIHTKLEYLE